MSTIRTSPALASVTDTAEAVALLRTTSMVRERARTLLDRARSGESPWFLVDDVALDGAATIVADVTTSRYPDLVIPYHSRWRHFEVGGVDRNQRLAERLADLTTSERAAARIDLAVVSVLLDAGSGPDWSYTEPKSGLVLSRSEGLGVAGWHAFVGGLFSGNPDDPLRVDAAGLRALTPERLADAFQVGPANPLVGLEGRVELLRRLGAALESHPEYFGPDRRPGGLFTALGRTTDQGSVAAPDILHALLVSLADIWLAGNVIDGVPLGDCWRHPAAAGPGLTDGWVPLHKLSQWLTYSLLEPFEWAGIPVTDLGELTALAEYRNGGLLLDSGVLTLREPAAAAAPLSVDAEMIVEWRALTVALIDELAPLVRTHLGTSESHLPLACILEGGTWAAGRELARHRRGGLPPLEIVSNGTVF